MTERLLELLDARPGERILELGAGLGEVGELLLPVVGDGGEVVLTDNSPGMLQAAEERIGRAENLTFAVANAESTDFDDGSFDRVVARFALMLVPDVSAGFAEACRVLRPGGRLAFAVWATAPENPWGSAIGRTMLQLGLAEPPEPDAPGPFRLGDPDRLRSLLASSGFDQPQLESVEVEMRYDVAGAVLGGDEGSLVDAPHHARAADEARARAVRASRRGGARAVRERRRNQPARASLGRGRRPRLA